MLESATSSSYTADLYVNTTTYGTETCVGTMAVYLNIWKGRKYEQSAGHTCVAVRTIKMLCTHSISSILACQDALSMPARHQSPAASSPAPALLLMCMSDPFTIAEQHDATNPNPNPNPNKCRMSRLYLRIANDVCGIPQAGLDPISPSGSVVLKLWWCKYCVSSLLIACESLKKLGLSKSLLFLILC